MQEFLSAANRRLHPSALFDDPIGILMKVRDSHGVEKELLVGDVNSLGGICDCCNATDGSTLIAYRRVA